MFFSAIDILFKYTLYEKTNKTYYNIDAQCVYVVCIFAKEAR